jgi:hypothetical protein
MESDYFIWKETWQCQSIHTKIMLCMAVCRRNSLTRPEHPLVLILDIFFAKIGNELILQTLERDLEPIC